jgi:hypothetical protein
MRKIVHPCLIAGILFLAASASAQTNQSPAATPATTTPAEAPSTSTDIFLMAGSDFDRPGLLPRANLNLGIGHTFASLKKDPLGDELTFAYTYENAGSHGFFHTANGEHTEQLGLMKNFNLPKTTLVSGYTWLQSGITSYTGYAHVENRVASAVSIGGIVHLSFHSSIWLQETYSKVNTIPWYTTSSVGYTYSF